MCGSRMPWILTLALLVCSGYHAAGAEPVGDELLRPGEAQRILTALGLDELDQLPTYALDLSLSDADGRFEGRGSLIWTNTTRSPLDVLPLLLHPNAPGAEAGGGIELRSVSCPGQACHHQTPGPNVAEVRFETPVMPGGAAVVEFSFGGTLRSLSPASNDVFEQALGSLGAMAGHAGGADYGLLGQGDGLLTVANAVPMAAPFVDGRPRIDEPGAVGDLAWNQVANFDVRIVTPTGLAVVTNLQDGAATPLDGDTQIVHARGTAVRDLVIVASREWVTRTRRCGDVEVRSWSLARDATAGEVVLDDAVTALDLFESLLGPYPYTELDVVEATLVGGAGGVEFSSMVLVAGFLYRDPSQSESPMAAMLQSMAALGMGGGMPSELTDMLGSQRSFVVAHELAHQWCPGLVGTDARSHPVIDEPLAQYLAGRVSEVRLGVTAGRQDFDRNALINNALYRLLGGADAAANRPAAEFTSSLEYAGLVYGKAPYFYVAAEEEVGRAVLDPAIRSAVQDGAWQLVDTDRWLTALEEGGLVDARPLASRWWDGAHGDEDLDVDPEGERVVSLMFGDELAAQLDATLGLLGMNLGDLLKSLSGAALGTGPAPLTTPSPEEMLRLLE